MLLLRIVYGPRTRSLLSGETDVRAPVWVNDRDEAVVWTYLGSELGEELKRFSALRLLNDPEKKTKKKKNQPDFD